MPTSSFSEQLPSPEVIKARIDALDDELKALRRLLHASRAAYKADEARKKAETLPLKRKAE